MSEKGERIVNIRTRTGLEKGRDPATYDNRYFVANYDDYYNKQKQDRTVKDITAYISDRSSLSTKLNEISSRKPSNEKEVKALKKVVKKLKEELKLFDEKIEKSTSDLMKSMTYIGDSTDLKKDDKMYPDKTLASTLYVDLPSNKFSNVSVNELRIPIDDGTVGSVNVLNVDMEDFLESLKLYVLASSELKKKSGKLSADKINEYTLDIKNYTQYFKDVQSNVVKTLENQTVLKKRPTVITKAAMKKVNPKELLSVISGTELKKPKDVVNEIGISFGDKIIGTVNVSSKYINDFKEVVKDYVQVTSILKTKSGKLSAEKLNEYNAAIIEQKKYFKDIQANVKTLKNPTVLKQQPIVFTEKEMKNVNPNDLFSVVSGTELIPPTKIAEEKKPLISKDVDLYSNKWWNELEKSGDQDMLLNWFLIDNKNDWKSIPEFMEISPTVKDTIETYRILYEDFLKTLDYDIVEQCKTKPPGWDNKVRITYDNIYNNEPLNMLKSGLGKYFDMYLFDRIEQARKVVDVKCDSIVSNYENRTTTGEGDVITQFVDPKSFDNVNFKEVSSTFVNNYLKYIKQLMVDLYKECKRKTASNASTINKLQNDIMMYLSPQKARNIYVDSFINPLLGEYAKALETMRAAWLEKNKECAKTGEMRKESAIDERLLGRGWMKSDFDNSPITGDMRTELFKLTTPLKADGYNIATSPFFRANPGVESTIKTFNTALSKFEDNVSATKDLISLNSEFKQLSNAGIGLLFQLKQANQQDASDVVEEKLGRIEKLLSPSKRGVFSPTKYTPKKGSDSKSSTVNSIANILLQESKTFPTTTPKKTFDQSIYDLYLDSVEKQKQKQINVKPEIINRIVSTVRKDANPSITTTQDTSNQVKKTLFGNGTMTTPTTPEPILMDDRDEETPERKVNLDDFMTDADRVSYKELIETYLGTARDVYNNKTYKELLSTNTFNSLERYGEAINNAEIEFDRLKRPTFRDSIFLLKTLTKPGRILISNLDRDSQNVLSDMFKEQIDGIDESVNSVIKSSKSSKSLPMTSVNESLKEKTTNEIVNIMDIPKSTASSKEIATPESNINRGANLFDDKTLNMMSEINKMSANTVVEQPVSFAGVDALRDAMTAARTEGDKSMEALRGVADRKRS